MTRSPDDALRRLERLAAQGSLADLCQRHQVELLVAHGSVVDGAPMRPAQDLDLAFGVSHGERPDVLALTEDLLRLVEFDDIDFMDLRRAGPVARAKALAPTCDLLYEAAPGTFATAQIAALTAEMETRHLRRLDLELMAS